MRRLAISIPLMGCLALPLASPAIGLEQTLFAVQYPEGKEVDLDFVNSSRAPAGTIRASVSFREGLAEIRLRFQSFEPAILFGGEVTSYVLWAVTREGNAANLGEMWVREGGDTRVYTTPFKEFALLVTAESHPLVSRPSELVVSRSEDPDKKRLSSVEFTFSGFAPAWRVDKEVIGDYRYIGDTPLDLLQARKIYELAGQAEAERYAAELMREARVTLGQATNLSSKSGSKLFLDYARRTVALASEAIHKTERLKAAEELERRIAARRAEMEALTERATEAEAEAARVDAERRELEASLAEMRQQTEAERRAQLAAKAELEGSLGEMRSEKVALEASTEQLTAEREALAAELKQLEASTEQLEAERAALAAELQRLEVEKQDLEQTRDRLRAEKEELSARLQGALSQVAETQSSARGLIVSLPDILFDLNKAELKAPARLAIAKLAGILLLMPELNLRIEGHTDSTGPAEFNRELSEARARSVFELLAAQGVAPSRMDTAGYGPDRPVAENTTAEGRARNRRVEVVIAEGEVEEAR